MSEKTKETNFMATLPCAWKISIVYLPTTFRLTPYYFGDRVSQSLFNKYFWRLKP